MCWNCGWRGEEGSLLTAPSPFTEGAVIAACPACEEVCNSLHLCCDEPGCFAPVSCGTPVAGGYRSTCHDHAPPLEEMVPGKGAADAR